MNIVILNLSPNSETIIALIRISKGCMKQLGQLSVNIQYWAFAVITDPKVRQ